MHYVSWLLLALPFTLLAKGAEDFETEMMRLDETFFQRSFNECDMNYLKQHISNDLVFYHDQSGQQTAELFLKNVEKNICSGSKLKPIRKRSPGSLKNFPLYKNGDLYGAIQHGEHAFYLKQNNEMTLTSTARFTHTWLLNNGSWKLSSALSYDHQSPDSDEKALLETMKKAGVTALGIGVLENGKMKSSNVLGTLNGSVPAPENTLFKVASLTKPIVTLVTLKLVHAGKLSLDESLSKYWVDPDIKDHDWGHLLTPRIILSHESGFDNWRRMSKSGKLTFNYKPGKGFGYSGEGFEYLRKALERKFDQPLEQLAKRYVFEPAGMHDTHFWWDGQVDESRYAHNFDENGDVYPLNKYYEANAAANLITTTRDYTLFMQYIFQQQQLMPELYALMVAKSRKLGKKQYFSLGWEILSGFKNGEYAVLHTGKDPGVNALALFFSKSKNGYVLLMNGDNSLPVMEQVLPRLYLGSELWNRR
ncbi:serine hydrolase [Idiomarina piscisalsi]|uniref:serine hydrolase domain-containing protein n=1 Tax=Idiomarina piscisalsi TaxID=1096243 RepID=UPI0013834E90|nr:serine hydrolase domain-containing protein [Idiomarina piscisalsi]MTJ02894.1 DUF4440 domain-containing protein [Idiomarina piscisalsi]